MVGTVKKILIGASVVASMSAIASSPAFAGSITGASIGGTASTDYLIYDSNGTNTFLVPNNQANLQKVLDGDSSNPTGNVELAASSEQPGFNFSKYTSLTGQIGGKDITLSSLTYDDWTSDMGGITFGQKWFNDALTANGFAGFVGTQVGSSLFSSFVGNGGYQRFSDPNISYVNQDDQTGNIKIGLAGHYDASSLLLGAIPDSLKFLLAGKTIQASEVVKVTYDGKTNYNYSFTATKSGLVAADDGKSHNGNYEVDPAAGVPAKSVPEPSGMLELIAMGAVGAFFAAKRKLLKKA